MFYFLPLVGCGLHWGSVCMLHNYALLQMCKLSSLRGLQVLKKKKKRSTSYKFYFLPLIGCSLHWGYLCLLHNCALLQMYYYWLYPSQLVKFCPFVYNLHFIPQYCNTYREVLFNSFTLLLNNDHLV